ncbi:Rap1a/Tai family immunity protein [Bosea sp. TAF32]|uniref:Rap1a/Tai family immunity protein n=1 Tax=Bosea sp. TAF32 TaxID=3237482 RepID=UPI003F9100B2
MSFGAFALVGLSAPAVANGTALDLLNKCQRLDRSLTIESDGVRFDQDFATSYCWGFMSALHQTARLNVDGQNMLMTCVPPEVTTSQVIKIFIRFGERNPAQLHLSAVPIVINSLLDAYPCGKKK